MPVYTYECDVCKTRKTAFRPIERRDQGPYCDEEGESVRMHRVLDAPMGIVDGPAVRRGE